MANLASLLLERRYHDGPTHNLGDPNNWMIHAGNGGESAAGNYVNRDTALSYPPIWGALDLLACSVAKLPCIIYKKTTDGRERATDDPSYNLVRYRPNPHMTAFDMFKTVEFHRQACGGGYIYIFRTGDGQPEELYPLNPDNVYELMEEESGRLWYMVVIGGKAQRLDPANVIHIKGLSFDGITGYKPLKYAKEAVGLGLAAQQFTATFFKNGSTTRVVIKHPKSLGNKALQTLREGWEKVYSGLNNSHKAVILDEGMDISALTVNARDSQLNETVSSSIRAVATMFRVPPHKLGDTTRTAYASLEQENLAFIERLDDLLVPWEQELREKLLTEKQKRKDSHYFEFLRQALIRSDMAAKAAYYRQALGGAPHMTINEIRALENLNTAGEEYDEIIIPGNIAPTGEGETPTEPQATPAEPEPPKDDADRAVMRNLLVSNLRRVVRRLGSYARTAAKHPETYLEWLESNESRNGTHFTTEMASSLAVLAGKRMILNDFRAENLASEAFSAMKSGLMEVYDTVPKPQFAAAIDKRMDEIEAELPEKLADLVFGD